MRSCQRIWGVCRGGRCPWSSSGGCELWGELWMHHRFDCMGRDCLSVQQITQSSKAAAGSGDSCAARTERVCKVKCNVFCLAKEFGYACLLTHSLFHKSFGYVRKTRSVQHLYSCSSYPIDFS